MQAEEKAGWRGQNKAAARNRGLCMDGDGQRGSFYLHVHVLAPGDEMIKKISDPPGTLEVLFFIRFC